MERWKRWRVFQSLNRHNHTIAEHATKKYSAAPSQHQVSGHNLTNFETWSFSRLG